MMRTRFKTITTIILIIWVNGICNAQDIHFSQYFNTPMQINPALTGDIAGNKGRFILNYRNQWNSVTNNPYRTFAFSSDGSFKKEKSALGLQFFNDKVGDANMSTMQINISAAVRIQMNKTNFLRFGLLGSWSQHSLDISGLTWESQYDGKIFNPEISSGETSYHKYRYFDVSTGLMWKHLFNDKTEWNFGLSAYHVSRPKYSYVSSSASLPIRWCSFADISFLVGENTNMSIHPSFLFMKQGSLNETDLGLYVKYRLGRNSKYTGFYKNSFVDFGGYYRLNDAIIAYMKLEYDKRYSVGVSYDFNVSRFMPATKVQGSWELFLCFLL